MSDQQPQQIPQAEPAEEQQPVSPPPAENTTPAATAPTASSAPKPVSKLNSSARPFVPNAGAKPFVPSFGNAAPKPASAKTAGSAVPATTAETPAPVEEQKQLKFDPREHLNVVFIGHVDAGKSTLCGQLRNLAGQVDARLLEKLQREAKEKNRETWIFAYIMDVCEEEREKGKTIEVSTARFETKNKRYTILDAPGHECYVNNMIMGASQADIAILVISAKKNEFERGFDKGGQTREHATLAKTLGVKELVCVVNKMDDPSVNWDQGRYDEIVKKVSAYLKQTGYKLEKEVTFLPISGQTGANMLERLDKAVCPWYDSKSFVEVLDGLDPIERNVNGPLRVPIVDKFRDKKGATCVLGKVESGTVAVGDRVALLPSKLEGEVVSLRLHSTNEEVEEYVEAIKAGDNALISCKGFEESDVGIGYVLCDTKHPPAPKVKEFVGQFAVLDKNLFTAGYQGVAHIHTAVEGVTITSLLKKLDKKTGKELPDKPKFGKNGDVITAKFELDKPICMEKFSVLPSMGRFTIREKTTHMVGKITAIKPLN